MSSRKSRNAQESSPLLATATNLLNESGLLQDRGERGERDGGTQDHPAFLRASHSPWSFIPQNVLVVLRGAIVTYLVISGVMTIDYKATIKDPAASCKWESFFDFGMISGLMVLIYHVIAFSWTFTHLYYPDADEVDGGIESWIVRAMSLPDNMGSLRKQFRFTLFYTTTTVFSFMNTTIYWFVTRPNETGVPRPGDPDKGGEVDPEAFFQTGKLASLANTLDVPRYPFSDLFGKGWFTTFNVFNIYGILSITMVIEILFLNSIKRPFSIASHLLGVIFSALLYLVWAVIGESLTGCFPFFWLDETKVGSQEAVIFYSIGFVLLAPTAYIFMQGLINVRETLIGDSDNDSSEA